VQETFVFAAFPCVFDTFGPHPEMHDVTAAG
jgi:hypothetical protein